MPGRLDYILRYASGVPLAIELDKLQQISLFLDRRAQGETVPEERVVEIMAARSARDAKRVSSPPGVAVLPVFGTIGRRLGGIERSSGGFDVDAFLGAFDAAVVSNEIGTIVLHVDSPGGAVPGVDEAARKVFEARSEKRIIAVADSLMASAAYYIGSAAHEVVVTPDGRVGSIGVYLLHFDYSRYLENEGIRPTIIKAGKFKAEGNPVQPLTEPVQAHLQEEIDDYYELFTDAIARHMGVSVAAVRNGFGEARALTAKRAVKNGLAHRIATLEDVLSGLGISPSRQRAARVEEDALPIAASEEAEHRMEVALADLAGDGEGTAYLKDFREIRHPDHITTWAPSEAGATVEVDLPPGVSAEDLWQEMKQSIKEGLTLTPDAGGAASEGQADIPAEPTAPAGTQENVMSGQDTAAQNGAVTQTSSTAATNVTIGHDPIAAERKRAREITQLCAANGASDRADGWIDEGISADLAGRRLLALKGEPQAIAPRSAPVVDLSAKENERYSLTRLIQAAAEGRPERAGFEMEMHAECAKRLGRVPKGLFVPTGLGPLPGKFKGVDQEIQRSAALTTTGSTAGAELVFTEPGSFIDMLRTRMVLTRMGATFLPGLQGNVSFPKQTGAGEFSWVTETSESDTPADSLLETGEVSLIPKNGRSITAVSRTLLAQSVVDVEQLIRRDLSAITARGIDSAGLHGTGQNNQPKGLYLQNGVATVPFGGGITFGKTVDLETAIADQDGDIGTMAYVTTPTVRGQAKQTQVFDQTNGAPLWTGTVQDGEMNGYRAFASNQVRKNLGTGEDEHGLLFGVWEHLLVGEWGAIEILVDPYTRAGRGQIRLVIFAIVDVAVRYPEAFAKATGLAIPGDS